MVEAGKRSAGDLAPDEPAHKHFRGPEYSSHTLDPEVQARLDAIYADGMVAHGDIDSRALSHLASIPVNVALEVLEEFAGSEMDRVRNKSAFLSGILNRFRKYGGNARLHPEIQVQLEELFKCGALQHGQLDARCIDALQTLPLPVALRAIERFSSRDLSEIRNVSAFFMSNVKGAMHESADEQAQHEYVPPALQQLIVQPPPPPPPRYRPADAQGAPGSLAGVPGLDAAGVAPTSMVPAGQAMAPAATRNVAKRNYALDQTKLGVRTDEFHGLSVFAVYVHPAPALKLQQLWDDGNPLVSLLDDPAWNALADLGAPEALAVIEETAAVLNPQSPQDNIGAVFLSIAQRYLPRGRPMVNATMGAMAAPTSLAPFVTHDAQPMAAAYPQSGYHDDGFTTNTYAPNGYRQQQPQQQQRGGDYGGDARRKPRPDVYRDKDRERAPGDVAELPLAVQQKIEGVLQGQPHFIGRHHFDEGVVDSLRRLAQSNAISVLEELEGNDLSTVRNVPAYIMGICKRYQQHRGDVGYIPPQQRV